MTLTTNEAARAHLLVYDIPQSIKMENPSAFLWSLGARINLSCWIIPDKNLCRVPVAAWKEKGAVVEMVRFDERDSETIMRLAREALERHLHEVREYAERCIDGTLALLDDVGTGDEAGVKKIKGRTQSTLRRARRDLAYAKECALTFDLTADFEHLFEAVTKAVVAREGIAYEAMKKKLSIGQRVEVEP